MTTSDAEVRMWARKAGHDVPVRGRLGEQWRDLYAADHPGAVFADNSGLSVEFDGGDIGDQEPTEVRPARPAGVQETAPVPPPGKGGTGSSLKRAFTRKGSGGGGRRTSLEDLAADGWTMMASLVASKGLGPTSRVLRMQAPVAGVILEDTLRGTMADRMLQPIARSTEKAREVSALLVPPIIVSILTVKPQAAEQLRPMLRSSLKQWVMIAGPKLKAREKKEAKAMAELGMEAEDLDLLLDGMIQGFFAPPQDAAEPVAHAA